MSDQMLMYALKGDSSGATAAFKDVGAAIQRTEDRTDKLASKMEQLQGSVQRAVANSSKLSQAAERMAQGASAQSKDVAGLVGNMGNLSGAVTMVTGAFAAMGVMQVAGWISNAAAASLEYGASLQDMSDRLGVSTENIQIYSAWAQMSGADTEALTKGIAKLTIKISEGDKELAKYGVTSANASQAFLQVVAAVEKAPTHIEKAAIANAAFGKSWQELMPVLNAGKDALDEISANTAIASPESIARLAQMDDQITQMRINMKSLGVEATALFGQTFGEAVVALTKKLKGMNDSLKQESDRQFVQRLGGKYVSQGEYDLSNLKSLDSLSSGDISRLIRAKPSQSGALLPSGTLKIDSGILAGAGEAYTSALDREALATSTQRLLTDTENQAAKDRLAADSDATTQLREQRKKAAAAEIEFQRQINSELEILMASSDQKELLRAQAKYDNMLAKHKESANSIAAINRLREAELQGISMDKNFANLASERDQDQATALLQGNEAKRKFQNGWGSNERARLARQMQNAGLIEENGVGVYDATQMSIKEMQEALDNYRTAIDPTVAASIKGAADMGDAWSGVANTITGDMASRFANAFIEMQHGTMSLSEAIGGSLLGALESVESKVLELTIQYGLLALLSGVTGGASTGGLGFLSFITKGLGGHADGTFSSPGGLKFLGERGGEGYQTPYGQRGIATYGLYQVPAGTRVTKTDFNQSQEPRQYHLHTSEADPVQVAAIFERMIERKISEHDANSYRTRV